MSSLKSISGHYDDMSSDGREASCGVEGARIGEGTPAGAAPSTPEPGLFHDEDGDDGDNDGLVPEEHSAVVEEEEEE